MKTILLTGSTGFLGSHLLRTLNECKQFKIIALKRSFSKLDRIKDMQVFSNIEFVDIDLLGNDFGCIFKKYKINVIIHTATDYGRNGIKPSEILLSNLIFPLELLQEGIANGLELFINTDSYFNKPGQTYKTLLDYSLSKQSMNLWLEYLSNKVKVVNLRLEHLYGPFDGTSKFCESIIQDIAISNKEKILLTDGQQKRDFVFVTDVCNAYLCVLNNYGNYHFKYILFEVGTGNPISIREFVEKVKELSVSNSELCFGELPYREDEIMCSKADISGLQNWGWIPKIDYINGIEIILKQYKL